MKFKKYIDEGLYVDSRDPGRLHIAHGTEKQGDSIESLMGKNKNKDPYTSKSAVLNGITVYSAYSSKEGNKEAIEFLKALKGKSDVLTITDEELEMFVKRTVVYLWSRIKNENFDLLVQIPSSSKLANMFSKEFASRISNVIVFDENIKKANINNVKIYDKASPKDKEVLQAVIDNIKNGVTSSLEIKKINARQRYFIYDFLELDPILVKKIEGKSILLIDDYLTTGTTIGEVVRLLNQYNPSKIIGATILKSQ